LYLFWAASIPRARARAAPAGTPAAPAGPRAAAARPRSAPSRAMAPGRRRRGT